MSKGHGFSTKNIHIGNEPEFPVGAINPPIYASSTFIFPSVKAGAKRFSLKEEGTIYSRWGNPTVTSLEKRLAALEGTETALAFSSGMNAITSIFFHILESGDEIVAHKALYGGTFHFLNKILPKFNVKTNFVDFKDLEKIEKAITNKTKAIYFETPTNPLMEIIDIKAVSFIGKKNKKLVIIDNTFAPPFIQSPAKLGVDVIVHSLTKYINGHSDLIGGALMGSENFMHNLKWKTSFFLGGTMSPFTAFLILRGMATLKERLTTHSVSALEIAKFLEKHPKVETVYYPGLLSHPNHTTARKQMKGGYGGIMSFVLKGGFDAGRNLMEKLKLIRLAVSLGAVESLIEHPASMTHSEYSKKERERAGIFDGLVRLSVGLEEKEDIISDLTQALKKV
jgi:methionine-gamma-lyase